MIYSENDIKSWNVDELLDYLRKAKLSQPEETFIALKKHKIDGEAFLLLTQDHLEKFLELGLALKMDSFIKKLKGIVFFIISIIKKKKNILLFYFL